MKPVKGRIDFAAKEKICKIVFQKLICWKIVSVQ